MTANTGQRLAVYLIVTLMLPSPGTPKKGKEGAAGPPILWSDPADIATRDLIYGPGGEKDQPKDPFVFVKEDMNGSSPKFIVKDADGVKWKVKLGAEVRAETAASRIVWAAGYFADEDYFVPDLIVRNIPANLHRGQKYIDPDGYTHNARLKRYLEGEEKFGEWKWKDNPFTGTKEFNGLRVMMALINNWDLKDDNTAIYDYQGHQIYLVKDLGASFGTTGFGLTQAESKGNMKSYTESKFIEKVRPPIVDFDAPARPALI